MPIPSTTCPLQRLKSHRIAPITANPPPASENRASPTNPFGVEHLILAGPTRSASTMLYNAMAQHPRIARSTIKETRFFMPPDSQLHRMTGVEDGLGVYANFFSDAATGTQAWLEASPDYLFSPQAATAIGEHLPAAHVVFVLREPIARLVSWHRYAIQRGMLPETLGIDDYIEQMIGLGAPNPDTPQPLRALAQNHYEQYLPAWLKHIHPDRLHVWSFDQVTQDPAAATEKLCGMLGLQASDLPSLSPDTRTNNASTANARPGVQRAIRQTAWALKPLVHNRPALRKPLRAARRGIQAVLGQKKTPLATTAPMSEQTLNDLEKHYAHQPATLSELLNTSWHWPKPHTLEPKATP